MKKRQLPSCAPRSKKQCNLGAPPPPFSFPVVPQKECKRRQTTRKKERVRKRMSASESAGEVREQCNPEANTPGRTAARCGFQLPTAVYPHRAVQKRDVIERRDACDNLRCALQICVLCMMYVCIYVCMYVCMYACMYVCMHACMYVCMCMHACMHACMYVM